MAVCQRVVSAPLIDRRSVITISPCVCLGRTELRHSRDMACKRAGVRVPLAPRFRSSEAVYGDLERLLIVQEVTLSGELTWPDVLAGQRAVTALIGHICGPGLSSWLSAIRSARAAQVHGGPGWSPGPTRLSFSAACRRPEHHLYLLQQDRCLTVGPSPKFHDDRGILRQIQAKRAVRLNPGQSASDLAWAVNADQGL